MDSYICTVCGYVYNPEVGDKTQNIEPRTSFESLPENWICPLCKVGKDMFKKQ